METGLMQRSFREDFLAASADLADFFPSGMHPEAIDPKAAAALAQRFAPHRRQMLSDVAFHQLRALGAPHESLANAAALALPNTLTVCTGQQPGLLGGPLYVLYKALSAIAWANWLQQHLPGHTVVPVFWVASEDHDWAEVNQAWKPDPKRYTLQSIRLPVQHALGAVGRHRLTAKDLDGLGQHVPDTILEHWQPGRTWAQAFAAQWLHLLGQHGLVVLNPDDPHLKSCLLPVLGAEMERQLGTRAALLQSANLNLKGYSAPLQVGNFPFFWLSGNQRQHMDPQPDGGVVLRESGRMLPREAMWAQVEDDPACLSPNAMMRPLYQQLLLPNLLYVGGWAEVNYWAQLAPVLHAYGAATPVVYPRASALLVPEAAQAFLNELGLPGHLWHHGLGLSRQMAAAEQQEPGLEKQHREIIRLLGQYSQQWQGHPQLGRHAAALQAMAERRLLRARNALLNASLRANFPWREYVAARNLLEPNGFVQERSLGVWGFEPNRSARDVVRNVFSALDPLLPSLQRLILTD